MLEIKFAHVIYGIVLQPLCGKPAVGLNQKGVAVVTGYRQFCLSMGQKKSVIKMGKKIHGAVVIMSVQIWGVHQRVHHDGTERLENVMCHKMRQCAMSKSAMNFKLALNS
jgi:hypothetical protein